MSISRGSGVGETSSAIAMSSSVVLPRAESTATTRCPASRLATMRRAACLIRSASATEVPPNFITMMLMGLEDTRGGFAAPLGPLHGATPGEGPTQRHLLGGLEVRADRH